MIGSSSGLRIACRNAVVMSNVKILRCMLSANTSRIFRTMSTGVEAHVSSKSWIHCVKPLAHSRLLTSMPFHLWTDVKSSVLVICSSVNAEVGTTSATSKSAIICMSQFIVFVVWLLGIPEEDVLALWGLEEHIALALRL